jgi:hypothetical protein
MLRQGKIPITVLAAAKYQKFCLMTYPLWASDIINKINIPASLSKILKNGS